MSHQPLVSAIIIFLNAEKFLREAIESVFAQTYEDWELLPIDDGSTDASTEIAKEYAERYPQKVRYLEHDVHQNKGMSASRNLGIAHARGEFIAFLDADDVWLPDKLEKQVAILERHSDIDLLVNPALYWYENGVQKPQPMTCSPGLLPPGTWIPKILESDDNTACPSAVLIKRQFAIKLGGFEESFQGHFEDQVMWFKASMSGSVYHDPEYVLLYRIHPESCCATTTLDQRLLARMRAYSWLIEFLQRDQHRQLNSKLLTAMTRSRLCDAILQFASLPLDGIGGSAVDTRVSRLRMSMNLMRTYIHSLGPVFVTPLLLSVVSERMASAVSRKLFAVTRIVYDQGRLKAW